MRSAVPSILLVLLATACTPTATTRTQAAPGDADLGARHARGGETIELIAVLDGDSIEARVDGDVRGDPHARHQHPRAHRVLVPGSQSSHRGTPRDGHRSPCVIGGAGPLRATARVRGGGTGCSSMPASSPRAMPLPSPTTTPIWTSSVTPRRPPSLARLGLWGATACGPRPGHRGADRRVDGNPPGQDDDPRDGESAHHRQRGRPIRGPGRLGAPRRVVDPSLRVPRPVPLSDPGTIWWSTRSAGSTSTASASGRRCGPTAATPPSCSIVPATWSTGSAS